MYRYSNEIYKYTLTHKNSEYVNRSCKGLITTYKSICKELGKTYIKQLYYKIEQLKDGEIIFIDKFQNRIRIEKIKNDQLNLF